MCFVACFVWGWGIAGYIFWYNASKSMPFHSKKIPKYFLYSFKRNFEKSRKLFFRAPKIENYPKKRTMWVQIWLKISISQHIYEPLGLKIDPKVCHLRPKILPKRFWYNSKITFKKCRKRLFLTPKLSKQGYKLGQLPLRNTQQNKSAIFPLNCQRYLKSVKVKSIFYHKYEKGKYAILLLRTRKEYFLL